MTWTIFNEDAITWAKNYDGEPFSALLADPPYHLTSIVKRFGKSGSAPAKFGEDGAFRRVGKGFMNSVWDSVDENGVGVSFRPDTWEAFKGVMHNGAFGMAFSASRNWHRMAVAIEDAGFIIHPTMFFLWVQGQGFPKATKVKGYPEFEGYKYGLQALKPAVEPIIIFQKPYEGRPIGNILATGAGVLNIDGTRIPLEDGDEYVINEFEDGMKPFGDGAGHKYKSSKQNKGRYPSNLILDEQAAEELDKQTGVLRSGKMTPSHVRHTDQSPNGVYGKFDIEHPLQETIGDAGGASRFFKVIESRIDEADPFFYCGKVMPKERNAGLDELDWKATDDGRNKSIDNPFLRGETVRKNTHPTLKPIKLTTYLAKLLLPPDKYSPRRLFVPFSGVASEMIGGVLAGWDEVVGVEFDTENNYVGIAEKRLRYWESKTG